MIARTINDYYERSKNKELAYDEKFKMISILEDTPLRERLIESISEDET